MKRKVIEPDKDPIFKPARIDEHTHQSVLLQWTWNNTGRYPELQYFHAIPNGAKLPFSKTRFGHYSKQAMILKAEGLKRGVPDLCLPFPKASFHGLYIEMKALDGEPSVEQIEFVDYLNHQGYLACFAFGCDAAIIVLEWYLNQPKFGLPINGPIPPEAVRQIAPKPIRTKSAKSNRLSTQF